MKRQLSFDGFEPANTTPVPDVLFDELLPYLSEAELKVLLYIIRRTSGFKKTDDAISFSQFQNGITKRNGEILDQGCGVKNRTTISNALASLEKKGCIESDKNDDPQGDKATTVYRVRFQVDGVVRKTYHGSTQNVPPVVSETYHGSTDEALPVVRKTYPQETVIQQTALQETVRQEDTIVATSLQEDRNAPANVYHFEAEKKRITNGRIPAVNASHSQVDIGNDDEEDISLAETTKHKAMPKQTPGAGSPPAATPPGGSTAASAQASLTGPPVDAAQRTASSPGTPSGAVQASIPKRPRGKVTQATLKSPEEIAIDERCRALQQRINEWRGYPLEAKGQIINEYKSIRKLIEKYTDQQIEDIYVYLFTRHWKWSKPDNRYHIGAYVVLSEAQSVLQELKAPPSVQNGKAPTFVIDEERNRRNIEAMKARNAARRLAANG